MKSFALAICLLLLGGAAQAQTPAPLGFKGSSQQWLTSYPSQACCMGFFSLQTSRRRGCAELWETRPRVFQGLVGIA